MCAWPWNGVLASAEILKSASGLLPPRCRSFWRCPYFLNVSAGPSEHPGHRDDRVEAEDMLENAEDSELHEQQRDRHVEHEPDDAPGMTVGHPREEIRPRDRTRIGVGDVDLELRNDHERAGK